MDIELYFKKIYAVTFKLTGNENMASEIATTAITNANEHIKLEKQVTLHTFQFTVMELVKIFLNKYKVCYTSIDTIDIQKALLNIMPIRRVTVIWRDILGFNISDNIPVENFSKKELLQELSRGRKEMMSFLKLC